jgi:hypothetical protein
MNIAIVGASGAVGQELLRILGERHFPVTSLRLFGSARSAGATYTFCGQSYTVELLEHGDLFRVLATQLLSRSVRNFRLERALGLFTTLPCAISRWNFRG